MIMVITMATILPFTMSGMDKAYASVDAYDRVKYNGSNTYIDHLAICGLSNEVEYRIVVSGNTRTLQWYNAPDSVTCSGTTYNLDTVIVVFEKSGPDTIHTITNPQSTSSVTNYNDSTHNKITSITLTYS